MYSIQRCALRPCTDKVYSSLILTDVLRGSRRVLWWKTPHGTVYLPRWRRGQEIILPYASWKTRWWSLLYSFLLRLKQATLRLKEGISWFKWLRVEIIISITAILSWIWKRVASRWTHFHWRLQTWQDEWRQVIWDAAR